MNQKELQAVLPHRENMLLLNSAERDGDMARGEYHVRGDEWFLQGHFPGHPVVPGIVLCEIMAQSVSVLLSDKMKAGCLPLFSGLDKVRFKHQVKPGDTVKTQCSITKARAPFYFAKGEAYVDDTLCVTAEFSFVIAEE